MRKGRGVALLAFSLLLLGSVVWGVRLARHCPAARVELARIKTTSLDEVTQRRLRTLHEKVFITYYVSPREQLPSHMRRMEEQFRDLCQTLHAAAPEHVDFQILDPGSHPDLERYAAKRKASPVRVRSIERDAYSERTVWSTLTVAYGQHAPAVVNGLRPEQMPRLQALIVAELDQMEAPRKPVIALAGAESLYKQLREALSVTGNVVSFDLTGNMPLPEQADVLFWMDPRPVSPERLRELELFLQRGRSIVLAGGLQDVQPVESEHGPALAYQPTGYPAEAILSRFGLTPVRGLVFDRNCEKLTFPSGQHDAPCLVRCIAYQQDFRTLTGQPNGSLLFCAPTALALDAEKLERSGLHAEILATTSDNTWILPEPAPGAPPLALASLDPASGESAPRQILMAAVRSDDPTRGLLIACASSSPFKDGTYGRESTAHERLLKTLTNTLCSPERLVQNEVGVLRPDPVPELGPTARALWRALCVFLLPALLFAQALARGAFGRGTARAARTLRPTGAWTPFVLRGMAGATLVLLVVGGARALALSLDLSQEGINGLASESRAIALAARGVKAELCFSDSDHLPPSMRVPVSRVRDQLRTFSRAGAEIEVETLRPDDLDPVQREALAKRGYSPTQISSRDEEVTTVRSVYSALRLSSGGRTELLAFPDPASFEQLEFRISFALWRLQTGEHPQVAFASDVPRLSPAQVYDYQQAGLTAPMGTDVYGLARELLTRCDFDVEHLNPRDPKMPEHPACLVWLQPRRPAEPMYEQLIAYLHHGGHVFLSSQHFLIESRQYPGSNFVFDYWPRPESPDIDTYYFPALGAKLVRQPFFDDMYVQAPIDSQVKKSAQTTWTTMDAALPFMVRASAANYEEDSPVTRNLGDQAMLFCAGFELEPKVLSSNGLVAKSLITSSEHAWSFDWTGGWIPDSLLAWPPASSTKKGRDGADVRIEPVLRPRTPLAIELSGTFPYPKERIDKPAPTLDAQGRPLEPQPPSTPYPSAEADPASPGRMVWVGCSEMFKNYRLHEPSFRADQLLLNAVASLALPADLARIAARRPVPRGFGAIESDQRLRLRSFVLGAFPTVLVLYGLLRALLSRPGRTQVSS